MDETIVSKVQGDKTRVQGASRRGKAPLGSPSDPLMQQLHHKSIALNVNTVAAIS